MILNNNEIESMSCTCPRGQDKCHHMASFAFYCHYNISVTDQQCKWSKPKSMAVAITETVEEVYPSTSFRATRRDLSAEERSEFNNKISNCRLGFSWLLRPEASESEICLLEDIETLLLSEEYKNAINKKEFFSKKLKIDTEKIKLVEKSTRGQAKNENWLVARKFRLTASKFGLVIKAIKKQKFSDSFFKTLLESYTLEGVKAIQWGRNNEEVAVKRFCEDTNKTVAKSGLWLDTCGFLGASPDGIVVEEDAIIEVKCPYKYRNEKQLVLRDPSYIIYYNDNDEDAVVNINHNYYHQIQGELYISQKKVCYLIIWTPNDVKYFTIEKQEEWGKNIDDIKCFYLDKFLEYVRNK